LGRRRRRRGKKKSLAEGKKGEEQPVHVFHQDIIDVGRGKGGENDEEGGKGRGASCPSPCAVEMPCRGKKEGGGGKRRGERGRKKEGDENAGVPYN